MQQYGESILTGSAMQLHCTKISNEAHAKLVFTKEISKKNKKEYWKSIYFKF